MKRIADKSLISLLFCVFVLLTAADASCIIELQDPAGRSHVAVETCVNIGVFSVGTLQAGNWESLTYKYPKPWKGTYLALKVDQRMYSNSVYSTDSVLMDEYVTFGPKLVGSDSIVTKWSLPEGVEVEQQLRVAEGGAIIQVKVINRGSGDLDIAGRLSLDLMVDGNDGAPVYVPGKGVMSKEFSYSGSAIDFDYVDARVREIDPWLVRKIQLAYGLEKPSKVVFANWKTSRSPGAWDYEVDMSKSTALDSAVLLYYGSKKVSPGGVMDFAVHYGEEVVAPTCYDGVRNQGETDVDCGGPCDPCALGASCLVDGDCVTGSCSKNICAAPVTPTTKPQVAPGPALPIGQIFMVLIIVAILAVLAFVLLKKPIKLPSVVSIPSAKGEVLVSKSRTDNTVRITVENTSSEKLTDCVLVETVPTGADIKFNVGKNVHKKRRHLTWNIGELAAGEQAVLEYTMSSEKKSKIDNFSFLSKNPVFAKLNER